VLGHHLRSGNGHQRDEQGVETGDLVGQVLRSASQFAQGGLGGRQHIELWPGTQGGGGGNQLQTGQVSQRLTELVGCGRHQTAELIEGLGAVVAGRRADHPQHANGLYAAVSGLGRAVSLTGERGTGGRQGVDGVALAHTPALLAVRSVHLHYGHAGVKQVAGEASSVAAGAFHSDLGHRPEAGQPPEQLGVTGCGGRKRFHAELSADAVKGGGHVHVEVGVDAAEDGGAWICHGGHGHPFIRQGGWDGTHLPGRRTRQRRAFETGS
jgi:hypothetical protein